MLTQPEDALAGNGFALGAFDLHRRIGIGGMGQVYAGVHRSQGIPVAVKLLHPKYAQDVELAAQFRGEVRAVAALDHPNIVVVLDYGEISSAESRASRGVMAEGAPYLVMELIEGGALSRRLRELDWMKTRNVVLGVLDGLAHAHARGVIHRDIKGGNILITDERAGVKLTDFGIAHLTDRGKGAVIVGGEAHSGTLPFMAPEQFEGAWRDFGPWTDLYSLGVLIWRIVTGRKPYRGDSFLEYARAHLSGNLPKFQARFPVPDDFEDWLRMLLHVEPHRRYRWAADAAFGLRQLGLARDEGLLPGTTEGETSGVDDMATTLIWGRPDQSPSGTVPPLPEQWRRARKKTRSAALLDAGQGLFGLRTIPLIDREPVRNTLWSSLHRVRRDRRAKGVILRGPAGVGKSRLAEWLTERAHEMGGATVLRAVHGPSPGSADGIIPMIGRHLVTTNMGMSELRTRVRRLVSKLGATDAYEWKALSAVLQPRDGEDVEVQAPNPVERHALLRRLLERLSVERPVIVWLDDVQWGLDAIAFAQHILAAQSRSPQAIYLLLTIRDEALAEQPAEAAMLEQLARNDDVQTCQIGALAPGDSTALVYQLLRLESTLAKKVAKRVHGNPLFAVQLVGDWVQRGILEVGDEGFCLRQGVRVDLPDSVHEVWASRLDRLLEHRLPADGYALEVAAALGQQINTAEWEVACGIAGCEPSPRLVERLIKHRLARGEQPGQQWAFVHGMLRESLELRALDGGRHQVTHRACAAALTELAANGVAHARIGHHLNAAGDYSEAADALLMGVTLASRAAEHELILSLADQAEAALGRAKVDPSDPRRGHCWVRRARSMIFRDQRDNGLALANRALEAARKYGWAEVEARAVLVFGSDGLMRWDLEEADVQYSRAIEMAAALGLTELQALALKGKAVAALYAGRLAEARDLASQASMQLKDLKRPNAMAATLVLQAAILNASLQTEPAGALLRKALTFYEIGGGRLGYGAALGSLAKNLIRSGQLEEARATYLEALRIAEELDSALRNPLILGLAKVDILSGRAERALEKALEVRALVVDSVGRLARADALLCEIHATMREWRALDERLIATRSELEESGVFQADIAEALEAAGTLACAAGERERGHKLLDCALEQYKRLNAEDQVLRVQGLLTEMPS